MVTLSPTLVGDCAEDKTVAPSPTVTLAPMETSFPSAAGPQGGVRVGADAWAPASRVGRAVGRAPRTTELYHTVLASPTLTFPMREALGASRAESARDGGVDFTATLRTLGTTARGGEVRPGRKTDRPS